MTKLKILDASYECGIGDKGIENINLEELNASDNQNISNVNHMTKLKILDASYAYGIENISLLVKSSNNLKITKF